MMDRFWKQDVKKTQLEGLRWSLQLTDRTLSGVNAVKLTFQNSAQAAEHSRHPAYSIGTDIFINKDKINEFESDRGIASLLGLNYHELAHVVYTWFNYHDILNKMPSTPANFADAYNILEEARVESLLAARYPRMEKYFTLVLADFIVGSQDPDIFFLVHGRKYLPKKIRSMYRDFYVKSDGEERAAKAEALIDEYRTILYPRDMDRAAQIIDEFCKLLPQSSTSEKPHTGAVTGSVGDKTATQNQRGAQKDAERAKDREGQNEDSGRDGAEDDQALPSDQGGGKGQEGDGSQSGDQTGRGLDGDDSQDDHPGRGRGAAGDHGTSEGGQNAGKGDGDGGRPLSLKEIADDILEDLVDQILQDSSTQQDIASTRSAMHDLDNGMHSSIRKHPVLTAKPLPVTDAMRERSARYAEALRQIWLAMEPGWTYGASEGRLDMNRVFSASTPEEMESVYASWDEGQQHNSKARGVIISDESSSMRAQVMNSNRVQIGRRDLIAARNIWEIKRACEEVDIDIAVITYDSTYRLLYDFGEPVDPNYYFHPCNGGGTEPEGAVYEARRILSQTEDPGRFLIVESDGEWLKNNDINDSLNSLDNVVKACGLIGFSPDKPWGFEDLFDIVRRSSGDMFGLMSEVVTQIMTRNLEGW